MIDNIVVAISLFLLLCICFVYLNRLIKKTNWYKNIFIYTNQFAPNPNSSESALPFLRKVQRQYDIVNLGSNDARFGFFWEDESVYGQNWSPGGVGPNESFEILKRHFSFIKKNGIVLIPIGVLFSIADCSKADGRSSIYYCAKILKAAGSASLSRFRNTKNILLKKAALFIKYPLLIKPYAIRYLFRDHVKDERLLISEQSMQSEDLNDDVDRWSFNFKKEFGVGDFSVPLTEEHKKCFDKMAQLLSDMIDFCIEHGLRPVLISLPATKYFSSIFSPIVREQYLYSMIRQANKRNILYLDYYYDERFQDPQYYFSSFFLNLRGRKLFTKQVLQDLAEKLVISPPPPHH
jgi:hypothetical protein